LLSRGNSRDSTEEVQHRKTGRPSLEASEGKGTGASDANAKVPSPHSRGIAFFKSEKKGETKTQHSDGLKSPLDEKKGASQQAPEAKRLG